MPFSRSDADATNALENPLSQISPFEQDKNFVLTIGNVARGLSTGILPRNLEEIVNRRKATNTEVGRTATANILGQPDMISHLRAIEPSHIGEYLDKESVGSMGQELLAKYLTQILPQFGAEIPATVEEVASRRVVVSPISVGAHSGAQ